MKRHLGVSFRALLRPLFTGALAAVIVVGCQNRPSSTETLSDDEGGGAAIPNGPSYGQYPVPYDDGDIKQGPGQPSANLPPGSPSELPGIEGQPKGDADPGADFQELGIPKNYSYQPIVKNYGDVGPFNPAKQLPDPTILNLLYCYATRNAGGSINDRYDYVMGVVVDLLGRVPDTNLATQLVGLIPNLYDENQRLAVTNRVVNSAEFRTRFVNQVYGSFIERMPTASERATYVNLLNNGSNWEDVMSRILASPQFWARHTKRSRTANKVRVFVDAVYRKVAGRTAAGWERTRGVTFLRNQGGNNAENRRKFALTVINSPEVWLKFIEFSHVLYLGRLPSTYEAMSWYGQMATQGMRRMGVTKHLLASHDYLNQQVRRFERWTLDSYCRELGL